LRPLAHNGRVSQSYLPTYAATAWYHRKIPDAPDLAKLLAEAREFALSDYAVALAKGQRMSADERARVRRRLAYFTGLSEQYLDSTDLDVHPFRFMKELLRDRGLAVGRLDSRYVGRDFDAAAERILPVVRNRRVLMADPVTNGASNPGLAAVFQPLAGDLVVLPAIVGARSISLANQSLLSEWGKTDEELMNLAVDNLAKLSPPRFETMPGGFRVTAYDDHLDASIGGSEQSVARHHTPRASRDHGPPGRPHRRVRPAGTAQERARSPRRAERPRAADSQERG
jgi:hypothetical protein